MSYWQTYKRIIRLGAPMLVSQAGMVFTSFADNIMVGRYSTDALASASFVNNVFNMAVLATLGFTFGLTPLVGALFGRGEHRQIGHLLRNGLFIITLYSLAVTAVMGVLYLNLHRLGQPEQLLPLIRPYFMLQLCGIVPIALFNAFAQCSYGMRDTAMPMWIVLAGNGLNVLGNWMLIYGNWGCPEMGLTGAGIATLASRIFGPIVILAVFALQRRYAEIRAGWREARIRLDSLRQVFVTSFPVSLQLFCETAAFSGAAVMVGWLGALELASFQVMGTIGTLGFCFYYSLGAATAVLVSNAAGRHEHRLERHIGFAGYHLILVLAVCACLVFWFGGRYLIGWFTTSPDVIGMCMTLIVPMVLYQLGDATQVNFANALRGTSRVGSMLWIAIFCYLVVGLPCTYLFAFTLHGGLQGVFYSFSASLFLAGVLFLMFFLRNTRHE